MKFICFLLSFFSGLVGLAQPNAPRKEEDKAKKQINEINSTFHEERSEVNQSTISFQSTTPSIKLFWLNGMGWWMKCWGWMNKRGAKQLRCAVSEIKLIKLNAAPLKQRIQLIYLLSLFGGASARSAIQSLHSIQSIKRILIVDWRRRLICFIYWYNIKFDESNLKRKIILILWK